MLIDGHIHSKGISFCSQLTYQQVLEECLEDGVEGIVLSNHCKTEQIKIPYGEWLKKYLEEYHLAKEYGEKIGIKVLFSIEVTLKEKPNVDYLLYGLPEEGFLESPFFCDMNQKELFDYCVEKDTLLVQAHPYRNGAVPQNPDWLHGVEINCHPLYKTNGKERVTEFAKKHDLLLTCGSDYHGDTYKAKCGIIMPDTVSTIKEFEKELLEKNYDLLIHDILPDHRPKNVR